MERLTDRLADPFGKVEVELEFGKHGNRMFIHGTVQGHAVLQCQRCLERFELPIDTQIKLGLIHSEAEIESLLPEEEPLLLDESNRDELCLADVVEDELELILPMVARHSEGLCQSGIAPVKEEIKPQELKSTKKNPFAVLADLKKR